MDPHGRIGPYCAYRVGYSAGRHLPILEHNERISDNLVHISPDRAPPGYVVVLSR